MNEFPLLLLIIGTIGTFLYRFYTGKGMRNKSQGKKTLPKWKKFFAEFTPLTWKMFGIVSLIISLAIGSYIYTQHNKIPNDLKLDFEAEISYNKNLVLRAQNNTGYDVDGVHFILHGFHYTLKNPIHIDPALSGKWENEIKNGSSATATYKEFDSNKKLLGFIKLSCPNCETNQFFIHYDPNKPMDCFSMNTDKTIIPDEFNFSNTENYLKFNFPKEKRDYFKIK